MSPISSNLLFLGDLALDGGTRDVPPQLIDRLNDAIAAVPSTSVKSRRRKKP